MTIPELTETIEGASAVLTEISTEHTDPRLALVIAALGACAESLDRMWERDGAKIGKAPSTTKDGSGGGAT